MATPPAHLEYLPREGVESLVVGDEQVDLEAALLAMVSEYDVRPVRVDSGGEMAVRLLRSGLADELSLLVHPALAGSEDPRAFFRGLPTDESARIRLELEHLESLDDELVWLRYGIGLPRT